MIFFLELARDFVLRTVIIQQEEVKGSHEELEQAVREVPAVSRVYLDRISQVFRINLEYFRQTP